MRETDEHISNIDIAHPVLELTVQTNYICMSNKAINLLNFEYLNRDYYKCDFEKINEELLLINWNFLNDLNINEASDAFYDILNKLIYKYVPKNILE